MILVFEALCHLSKCAWLVAWLRLKSTFFEIFLHSTCLFSLWDNCSISSAIFPFLAHSHGGRVNLDHNGLGMRIFTSAYLVQKSTNRTCLLIENIFGLMLSRSCSWRAMEIRIVCRKANHIWSFYTPNSKITFVTKSNQQTQVKFFYSGETVLNWIQWHQWK